MNVNDPTYDMARAGRSTITFCLWRLDMSHAQTRGSAFPEEFDSKIYRSTFADLAHLSDDDLARHYLTFGRAEGRAGNGLRKRADFIDLIPSDAIALEIGPFCAPIRTGPQTKYFDILDQASLRARAELIAFPNPDVPFIDYVSSSGDLSIVQEKFDFIISSHCIEHQPDLIAHLKKVSDCMEPSGCYFLLIPDKRYCFDAFLTESNIAEVLEAHIETRTVHTLRSVIEHRALTTHNDCVLHWRGEHGDADRNINAAIDLAIYEYDRSDGAYIDVHAWKFTPSSFVGLITRMNELEVIDLRIDRIYPTRKNNNEFWCILQKI